ncbi:MAG TPA: peroxiredoxin, partial [Terriglobales bacterium]|nr:peroxiredoxin [Terriglobales bacterium]
YPKDFTNGCTIEAHGFQTDLPKYEKHKAEVIGVSADTSESHKEFCAKEGLNFHLLADPRHEALAKYDSLNEERGMARRNTFVIDPKGKVAKMFVAVDPNHHSQEVLAVLDEITKKK